MDYAVPISTLPSNENRVNLEFVNTELSNSEEIDNNYEEEVKRIEEKKIADAEKVEALETEVMQTAVKEDDKTIVTIYNPAHNINHMNSDILFNRMKNINLPFAAVAAGDEDERVLDKGIWISGTYGTNKQGTQKGFSGYKGNTSGGTIGFDIGRDSNKDLVGIAYTKLYSKFKSSGNKLNTNIDSHIVALYGQKELPKNFMIQGMFAYNHNIVKSKNQSFRYYGKR